MLNEVPINRKRRLLWQKTNSLLLTTLDFKQKHLEDPDLKILSVCGLEEQHSIYHKRTLRDLIADQHLQHFCQ